MEATFVVVSNPEDEVIIANLTDRNTVRILGRELEFEEGAEVGQVQNVILIIEDSRASAVDNGYFNAFSSVAVEEGAPVGIIEDNFALDAPPLLLELGRNLDVSEKMVGRLTVAHLLG